MAWLFFFLWKIFTIFGIIKLTCKRKIKSNKESEERKMFVICLLVFIGLCIYHASEPTIPADYHRNWKLESEDADKVRFGQMSRREFNKNIRNGKYR